MDRRRFLAMGSAAAAVTAVGGAIGIEEYRLAQSRHSGWAVGKGRPAGLGAMNIVWRAQTTQMIAALTFDDGPDPRYTPKTLDILDKYNIPGTFFLQGKHVSTQPELAKNIDARHALGNHSWSHADLSNATADQARDELTRTRDIIQDVTGRVPVVFRPPYGRFSGALTMIAAGMNYDMILWSDNADPREPWRDIANKLGRRVRAGSIVLAHDGGTLPNDSVLKALPIVIEQAHDRGIEFVTVPQLLSAMRSDQAGGNLDTTQPEEA